MNRILWAILPMIFLVSCSTTQTQSKLVEKVIRDTVFLEHAQDAQGHDIASSILKNYKVSNHHYPAKGQDYRQKFLIMHYTALHNDKSVEVLTQQSVSSHYLIKDYDDDEIYVLVGENERAWHAGVSSWLDRTNINDSSIGIEIVNLGYSTINGKMRFYPFPEHQFKKVAELAQDIVKRYEIDPTFVLGHSDVAPTRKEDPGAFFPWKRLYEEYGVGAWYDDVDKYRFLPKYVSSDYNKSSFIKSVQADLAKYGYGIKQTGAWDDQTKRVIMAFQLHFRPSNYSGQLDAETWAILQALNDKYRK